MILCLLRRNYDFVLIKQCGNVIYKGFFSLIVLLDIGGNISVFRVLLLLITIGFNGPTCYPIPNKFFDNYLSLDKPRQIERENITFVNSYFSAS